MAAGNPFVSTTNRTVSGCECSGTYGVRARTLLLSLWFLVVVSCGQLWPSSFWAPCFATRSAPMSAWGKGLTGNASSKLKYQVK